MSKEQRSLLQKLFKPSSVAIVGASNDKNRIAGRPLRYLLEAGYKGDIYPVNPTRDVVQGIKSYPDIPSLPAVPDLVLIAVPVALVIDIVRDCASIGVKAIYLLAAGFSEIGTEGEQLQRDIGVIAASHGIRILGPNCLGCFNTEFRFFGTFATSLELGLPKAGNVAIASQSGAYGQHLAHLAHRRNLGVSHFISTGNELDVEVAECIEWLALQPEVKVILAYAEGVRNGPRLIRAFEAARLARIPVVMVKVGTSDAGARAAASHTAALAGSDNIYDGIFRQYGVCRAYSVEEQLDIGYACARGQPMPSNQLGILSVSGGGGVHMADCAQASALAVEVFPDALQTKLKKIIPFGGTTNPVDVTGQVVNAPSLLSDSLGEIAKDGNCAALAIFLGTVPLTAAGNAPLRQSITDSTTQFRQSRPVVVIMIGPQESVQAYEDAGCLVYEDPARAIRALGALHAFGQSFDMVRAPVERKCQPLVLPDRALSEVEVKTQLRMIGVSTLTETLVQSRHEAAEVASQLDTSVAMKIVSPDVLHKTEIGGVLLNVSGTSEAAKAFDRLSDCMRRNAPTARFDGVLVSPMAPEGTETIIGTINDPTFGTIVMFGLGGVVAECYRDVAFRAAPLDADEAYRLINDTKAANLLKGWRGAAASDISALVNAICAISQLALDQASAVDSIEINPLRVLESGKGVLALDAVIATRKKHGITSQSSLGLAPVNPD